MIKTIGYVEDISYGELAACQDYAQAIMETYAMNHGGNLPEFEDDALEGLMWFLEHVDEVEGYCLQDNPDTVMEYGQNIIDEISWMVERSHDPDEDF